MYITRRMVGVSVIVLTFSSCNSKKEQQAFGAVVHGVRRDPFRLMALWYGTTDQ